MWRIRQFSLAVVVVGLAIFYEFQKWPSSIVLDIATVWDAEINQPTGGPAKILVG